MAQHLSRKDLSKRMYRHPHIAVYPLYTVYFNVDNKRLAGFYQ